VWGALFCLPVECTYTALRISTLVLALGGVLALYALIREIGADARTALIAAAALAVNPLWFALANTFMTDVPFGALSIFAIFSLVRGFRRNSSLGLSLGIFFSVLALLDRQLGIVLLAGCAVAWLIRRGRSPVNIVKALAPLVLGLGVHFLYRHWMIDSGRAPGLRPADAAYLLPASLASFAIQSIKLSASVLPCIGFFVLPVLVALPIRATRTLRILCGAVAGAAFVALWHTGRIPALGNVMLAAAFGPLTLRDGVPPPPAGATAIWLVATAVGAYGAYRMLLEFSLFARDGWRRGDWLVPFLATVLLSYWLLICLVAFNNGFFDRYLIFIVPVAAAMLCAIAKPEQGARATAPIALLLPFAVLSVAGTHDYLAWNRARWTATDFLTQRDIPADEIDGGYEFNELVFYEWHRNDAGNIDALHYKDVWQRWFAGADYVIASAPIAQYRQVHAFPYTRWLPPSTSAVLVLRKATPGG
jgi:4-amino-4-deoxy-L-arabinose transferase-like glycosyltransferase